MKRIKIEDLPKDMKLSDEDLKRVRGGFQYSSLGTRSYDYYGPWGRSSVGPVGQISLKPTRLGRGDIFMGPA